MRLPPEILNAYRPQLMVLLEDPSRTVVPDLEHGVANPMNVHARSAVWLPRCPGMIRICNEDISYSTLSNPAYTDFHSKIGCRTAITDIYDASVRICRGHVDVASLGSAGLTACGRQD